MHMNKLQANIKNIMYFILLGLKKLSINCRKQDNSLFTYKPTNAGFISLAISNHLQEILQEIRYSILRC